MLWATLAVPIIGIAAAIIIPHLAKHRPDKLWPDTYWRSERYVLIAVDSPGQMTLSFELGDGSTVGLVGPTVFSIGTDDRYIVVKQHPSRNSFGEFDRSKINYFHRTTSAALPDREKGVLGPMRKDEFEKVAQQLSLPPFSKTITTLE